MVKGLEVFREHFRNYADRYVLIGGAECDIAMTGAGLPFRATKDLDIVLFVEALDAAFVRAFWEFVRIGGYEIQEKSTGEKQFYRFQKPTNANYPFMLELFSRQPDVLQVADGSHLTPLPVEEDASSLSAILLNNDYYDFIRAGRQEIDGLPMVGAAQLIALKARAWLDLTERAGRGEQIDSKTIKKHKNDVFRLYQILDPTSAPEAPETVKKDIREFISRMRVEEVDLKSLGLRTGTRDGILAEISKVYRLAAP
ncbi:MAG: hypothetical protein WA172_01895 [Terriglobales bacterium]